MPTPLTALKGYYKSFILNYFKIEKPCQEKRGDIWSGHFILEYTWYGCMHMHARMHRHARAILIITIILFAAVLQLQGTHHHHPHLCYHHRAYTIIILVDRIASDILCWWADLFAKTNKSKVNPWVVNV